MSGTPSGNDLGGDAADAGAGQADGAGSAGGQVEHAAADERATVIDGHDDALAVMGHAQPGAERQRAVGTGHGALIETLARGGPAAGLVPGRNRRPCRRKAAAAARRRVPWRHWHRARSEPSADAWAPSGAMRA